MTISTELRNAFNFHRVTISHTHPIRAFRALELARADIENGRNRYTSSPWVKPITNQRFPSEGRNARQLQWIEKPATMGLRFVGYADEFAKLDHTGWFTDAYCDASIRGVVYQLPGRNGRARFVAGHDNPDNGRADNDGPALIDWSTIHESDFESEMRSALRTMGKQYHTPERLKPGYWAEGAHETARKDAANAADEFARVEAEQERDWQAAFMAGTQYADAMQERTDAKAELRALLAERRTLKGQASAATVAICNAVERQARALVETMSASTEKARKLMDGHGDEYTYFWPGDKRLQDAFNEGAGASIL